MRGKPSSPGQATAQGGESARQQRGQSLVEVSLVLPLVFFLLFAIIEGSFLVLSIETANFAAQAAGTALAQAGQDPTADAQALLAIRSTALGQTRLADVQEIDFERVSSFGTGLGSLNRYRLDGTPIGALGWAPTARNVQDCCADFVKVTIRLRYTYRSGLLGAAPGLTASSTGRLDPRTLNAGKPLTGPFPGPPPVRVTPPPKKESCSSTAPVWTQLHPKTNLPVRYNASMAYDSNRLVDVLFGGGAPASGPSNETWEWDGVDWRQRRPATSPSSRSNAAMAYDPLHRRVIMFGGEDGTTRQYLSDTWAWDGSNWTRLTPAGTPIARTEAGMIWNPNRGRMVLFGGSGPPGTNLGSESIGDIYPSPQYLSDSWEFDGTTWTHRTGDPRPTPRFAFRYSFDPVLGAEVLYGGSGYYRPESHPRETWLFRSGGWTSMPPAGPLATANNITPMAFLPSQRATVTIGDPGQAPTYETWQFDSTGWTQLHPTTAPPRGDLVASAIDPRGGLLVAFGPVRPPIAESTLWELNGCSESAQP